MAYEYGSLHMDSFVIFKSISAWRALKEDLTPFLTEYETCMISPLYSIQSATGTRWSKHDITLRQLRDIIFHLFRLVVNFSNSFLQENWATTFGHPLWKICDFVDWWNIFNVDRCRAALVPCRQCENLYYKNLVSSHTFFKRKGKSNCAFIISSNPPY